MAVTAVNNIIHCRVLLQPRRHISHQPRVNSIRHSNSRSICNQISVSFRNACTHSINSGSHSASYPSIRKKNVIVAATADEQDGEKAVEVAKATGLLLGQDPESASEAVANTAGASTSVAVHEEDGVGVETHIGPSLARIYAGSKSWSWAGHEIKYVAEGSGPAVVLVHGFGASIGHFRKNIPVLSESYTVYALDLLGQGGSAKPPNFVYTIEAWAELLVAFLKEVVCSPAVLVGNSIGSLSALCASAEAEPGLVRGTVLLNCAGGMNNKAIADDWRIRAAMPIFLLIDWLLLRPSIARPLFDRVRSRQNVQTVLQSVYCNKDAVDAELVEVILKPADDLGALEAFVSIITGPPGPRPEVLLPRISNPVLILWGDKDPFTPMNGPVGKFFKSLPAARNNVKFVELSNVGHCPHDDDPELVHSALLPWLSSLP